MAAHCSSAKSSVVYFVLCDYGEFGLEWIAREPGRMSRDVTISDIRGKQINYPVIQIIETEFGCPGLSSRDVTEEIMAEAGEIKNQRARAAMSAFDRVLADIDHSRDLRKHEVVS